MLRATGHSGTVGQWHRLAAARPHLITLLEGAKASEARQPRRPVVAERMDALLVALKGMQ